MEKNRIKYFKSLARKTLLTNWISQICAFLIVTVCFTGITYIGYAFAELLIHFGVTEQYVFYFPAIYIFLALFVTVPLLLGVFNFECKVVSGDSAGVSDVFFAFSGEQLLNRAYRIFITFVLKMIPGFIPCGVVFFYVNNMYPEFLLKPVYVFGTDVVYLCLNAAAVILTFLGIVVGSKNIVGLYYAVKLRSEDIGACFLMGRVASHTHSFEIVRLAISFFPIFIISLFTFGFLFVVYTLPVFFLSFVYMSEFLYNKKVCNMQTQQAFDDIFNGNELDIDSETNLDIKPEQSVLYDIVLQENKADEQRQSDVVDDAQIIEAQVTEQMAEQSNADSGEMTE